MIVKAALPLVIEYGASVPTSKIARAAGVGEGTIFRAFGDKEALLTACLNEALNPDDTLARLRAIAPDAPLADRLVEAAEILGGHRARMGAVAAALATTDGKRWAGQAPPSREGRPAGREHALAASNEVLVELLEPERDALLLPPERLANVFQFLVISAGPRGDEAPPTLTYEELVRLFLHGALATDGDPS